MNLEMWVKKKIKIGAVTCKATSVLTVTSYQNWKIERLVHQTLHQSQLQKKQMVMLSQKSNITIGLVLLIRGHEDFSNTQKYSISSFAPDENCKTNVHTASKNILQMSQAHSSMAQMEQNQMENTDKNRCIPCHTCSFKISERSTNINTKPILFSKNVELVQDS